MSCVFPKKNRWPTSLRRAALWRINWMFDQDGSLQLLGLQLWIKVAFCFEKSQVFDIPFLLNIIISLNIIIPQVIVYNYFNIIFQISIYICTYYISHIQGSYHWIPVFFLQAGGLSRIARGEVVSFCVPAVFWWLLSYSAIVHVSFLLLCAVLCCFGIFFCILCSLVVPLCPCNILMAFIIFGLSKQIAKRSLCNSRCAIGIVKKRLSREVCVTVAVPLGSGMLRILKKAIWNTLCHWYLVQTSC